jgi:hypothetical protein
MKCRADMKDKRTEIFGEENHANGVDAESDNFRDDHVYVPTRAEISELQKMKRNEARWYGCADVRRTYQIVISKATIMSSLRISAVKEIATMFRNSFSKSTSEMIMIAAPGKCERVRRCTATSRRTLIEADHEPHEKSLER